jgi:hypothetical protein
LGSDRQPATTALTAAVAGREKAIQLVEAALLDARDPSDAFVGLLHEISGGSRHTIECVLTTLVGWAGALADLHGPTFISDLRHAVSELGDEPTRLRVVR